MLIKYDFSNNNHEEIDLPSVIKINKNLVSITHASGTDSTSIPEEGDLVIQIGDTESYNPPTPSPEPTPGPSPDPTPDPGPDPTPDPDPDPQPEPQSAYVDLGLPSGTLWATGNIVKSSNGTYSIGNPLDKGCYFSWGNIDGHNEGDGYEFSDNVYENTTGGNDIDNTPEDWDIQGNATYDAATANLGSNYMLPSRTQVGELISHCTIERYPTDDYYATALKLTSTAQNNNNYILLPFSGRYDYDHDYTPQEDDGDGYFWTSIGNPTAGGGNSLYFAAMMYWYRSNKLVSPGDGWRRCGLPIRPVYVNNQSEVL